MAFPVTSEVGGGDQGLAAISESLGRRVLSSRAIIREAVNSGEITPKQGERLRAVMREEELTTLREAQWQSTDVQTGTRQTSATLVSIGVPGPVIVLGIEMIGDALAVPGNERFRLYATAPGSGITAFRSAGVVPLLPSKREGGAIHYRDSGVFLPIRRLVELPQLEFHVEYLAGGALSGNITWIVYWRTLLP